MSKLVSSVFFTLFIISMGGVLEGNDNPDVLAYQIVLDSAFADPINENPEEHDLDLSFLLRGITKSFRYQALNLSPQDQTDPNKLFVPRTVIRAPPLFIN